ncbi:MAG: imidazoleglycerol-phosphate dehydratase HisB [Planctomycetes bacterium]|nr:imidazoleglycerol-phosphate dehydratase HisB [Planctomycetota bacterium]
MTEKDRRAAVERKTQETQIAVEIGLDGQGKADVSTGVGFLDHMLDLLARHSLIDISVKAKGDTEVDDHHTVEDVGICLGEALREALGDKKAIRRFGSMSVPMDEVLANVAVDLSGRFAFVFNVTFETEKVGEYDSQLTEEFLQAFANNAGMNLHVNVPYGKNTHHINEAIFKGLAKALDMAVSIDPRRSDVPSTKGVI